MDRQTIIIVVQKKGFFFIFCIYVKRYIFELTYMSIEAKSFFFFKILRSQLSQRHDK